MRACVCFRAPTTQVFKHKHMDGKLNKRLDKLVFIVIFEYACEALRGASADVRLY